MYVYLMFEFQLNIMSYDLYTFRGREGYVALGIHVSFEKGVEVGRPQDWEGSAWYMSAGSSYVCTYMILQFKNVQT